MASKSTNHPSRVIHIRIKDTILLGILDSLTFSGIDPGNRPLSQCVNIFLESCIESLKEQGVVKPLDPSNPDLNPTGELNYRLGLSGRPAIGAALDPSTLFNKASGMAHGVDVPLNVVGMPNQVREYDQAIKRAIYESLDRVENPYPEVEGKLTNEEYSDSTQPQAPSKLNWETTKRIPLEDLVRAYPSNQWVMVACDMSDDKPLRLAVEIAFANVSHESYNLPVMDKVVQDLQKKLKTYDLADYKPEPVTLTMPSKGKKEN